MHLRVHSLRIQILRAFKVLYRKFPISMCLCAFMHATLWGACFMCS